MGMKFLIPVLLISMTRGASTPKAVDGSATLDLAMRLKRGQQPTKAAKKQSPLSPLVSEESSGLKSMEKPETKNQEKKKGKKPQTLEVYSYCSCDWKIQSTFPDVDDPDSFCDKCYNTGKP